MIEITFDDGTSYKWEVTDAIAEQYAELLGTPDSSKE